MVRSADSGRLMPELPKTGTITIDWSKSLFRRPSPDDVNFLTLTTAERFCGQFVSTGRNVGKSVADLIWRNSRLSKLDAYRIAQRLQTLAPYRDEDLGGIHYWRLR